MSGIALFLAALAAVIVSQVLHKYLLQESKLASIPTFGVPFKFGFYVGAWSYLKNARTITHEGYAKYPQGIFKVPLLNQYLVIVTSPTMIEEVRHAPKEVLSGSKIANVMLKLDHNLGHDQIHDAYQVAVVRTPLTRNLDGYFPTLRSEIMSAFEELVPAKRDEWTSVPALQLIMEITSRVYNRPFLGLICRNAEYISVTTEFAVKVTKSAAILHLVPEILRPIAMRLFGSRDSSTRKAMKFLGPILQERLDMDDKYGKDWPNSDRPNDLISWLLDYTEGIPRRRTVSNLTRTLLALNFAAIHTTTQVFIQAFYNLAAHPEYVSPLREEIESVVNSEGWTRSAMMGALRQAVEDFTFTDGTTIPAGTNLGIYTPTDGFDPFRFYHMRSEAGEGNKHQLVTPSSDFLSFGIGRQACPGRFLAANVLKLLLAHVIMTYDVKFPDGKRAETKWTAIVSSADAKAEVMFRKLI
ncbi:cytochrome P450 [Mycena vulgaris]|nr:cytochrome P450 [Mycena vulgaris]